MNRFNEHVKGLKIGQTVTIQAVDLGMDDRMFHSFALQLKAGTQSGYLGVKPHIDDAGLIDQITVERTS